MNGSTGSTGSTGPTRSARLRVRPGRSADVPALRDLERAAGAAFRDLGMDAVADDEPPAPGELLRHVRDGALHVAEDAAGQPLAYVLLDHVDGCVHVEQLSVRPDHARQGIGRMLLDHTARHAAATGAPALTLTAFADVPWNAPYYERCGFHHLPDAALTPGLRGIRAREAAAGLDRWPRVCMRRDLGPGPEGAAQ